MLWLLVTNSSRLVFAGSSCARCNASIAHTAEQTQRVPAEQLPTELPTVYHGDIHLY